LETQELIALQVDVLAGVFAAGGAELFLGDLVLAAALGAELLLDLPLDRQAVAVPAGDVVDVIAQQKTRADHEVLQRLVQGVADVDVAVGVGRAVVQHIERRLLRLTQGAQGSVQVAPLGQDFRLLLGQAAAHRERRLGQEDGVAIVAAGRGLGVGVGHGMSFRLLRARPFGNGVERQSSVKAPDGPCLDGSRRRRLGEMFREIPTCAGLSALQRYAGRLIEIGRITRRVMMGKL